MKPIEVGAKAPDFNALDQDRQRFFLSKALSSGKVLLAFYPADDTPVCSTELADYNRHLQDFQKRGVQLYGISISTNDSQKEFHQKLGLKFPLLADYDFRVTSKYGVMSFTGHPKRAIFLIGQDGKVLFRYVEPVAINYRSAKELLGQLDKISPPPASSAPTVAPQSTPHASH
jgi:thioredoxin-dependent peroxiredoxin